MKNLLAVSDAILGRYQSLSRDQMIEAMDQAIAAIPETSRASARFEIGIENYPYDEGDYPQLFIQYLRPETDEEEAAREATEARSRTESEEREKADFERLSAKFGK